MNRNERTPRTLADTMFHTGYTRASIERTGRIAERVIMWMAGIVVFCWALMALAAKVWG